jgi:hypothetical protein
MVVWYKFKKKNCILDNIDIDLPVKYNLLKLKEDLENFEG